MQIKFLNIYDNYIEPLQEQYELIGFWQKSIVNGQIDFITKAKVEFNAYTFTEYPDQERLANEIRKSITSGYDSELQTHFWLLNNKRYTSFEDLYNYLTEDHHLIELVITPEDYD